MQRLSSRSRFLRPLFALPLLVLVFLLVLATWPASLASVPFDASEQARIDCMDVPCLGDSAPARLSADEAAIKVGGNWYTGPKAYFGGGVSGIEVTVRPHDAPVSLQLRSGYKSPVPQGWDLLALAAGRGWIASRTAVRPGLEVIRLRSGAGVPGLSSEQTTFYVATEIKSADGLPVVASCNHEVPNGRGGSRFEWQHGISVNVQMSEKHCADWPHIYSELYRVLGLLQPV